MGQYRRKALVIELDRYLRNGLAPAVDKLQNTSQVLAGLTIGLTRLTNYDALYRLAGYVALKPLEKLRSSDSRQSTRNQLQWIGDCQSCTFPTVVNRKYPCQVSELIGR